MVIKLADCNFNVSEYIENFSKTAEVAAGSLLFHHGRVKLPGKIKPNMTQIRLVAQREEPLQHLEKVALYAQNSFDLLDVMIIHRIGSAFPKDDILLAGVCSTERESAFKALYWIVNEIKKEKIIRLIEQ